MNNHPPHQAGRRSSIRTVIVRLSRKLRATYRVRTGRLFSRLLAALLGAFAAQALALPQGGVVQSGTVTINTPNANSMVLNQGTQKAVIDWQSFSIGAGQSVQFVQPGASSVALNRVVGGDVSSIFGTLSANGQVFLVNPAGVLFAPGAQVNVGGLVASTLNLSNADFLAGAYTFSGDSGASVVNNGMIRAGYVALAGAQVANGGTIEAAQGGAVGLLAGSRVSVDPTGAGLVKFSVDSAAVNAAAANSGTIVAEGGQVLMAAQAVGDTLATVVNQSGVIRANTVAEQGGVITLSGGTHGVVKVSGTIEAKGDDAGEKGGTVKVLGDKVGLMAGAKVDVSGDAGGGTVLVGGNFQGKGPEQNAARTYVDRNASIQADATGQGDGGTVIVWADDVTRYGGSISAKGGARGGDGGFVEVSGKHSMVFAGRVDTTAANGEAGSLLLDPLNIIVDGSGVDDLELIDGTVAFADRAGDTLRLSGSALEFVGGNVLLQATNDITIDQYVELFTFGSKLTLDAGNDILVSAALRLNGGDFVATAGRDLKVNAGLVTMGGDFIAKAGRDIQVSGPLSTNGGDISATAGNHVVVNGALSAGSGVVHLRANSAGMPAGPSGTGAVTVGATSPISARQVHLFSGTSSATSAIDGSLTATESVTFSDIRANLKSIVSAPTVDIYGSVTLGASQRIADGATLAVQAGGSLDLGGFDETVDTTFLHGTVAGTGSLSALTHNLVGGTVGAVLAGGLAVQSSGDTTLSGVNTYTGGTVVNGGSLTLAHSAAAGTGGIDLFSGTLNINGGANVANNVFYASGTIGNTAGAGTLSGNVTLNGPGARFSSTGAGTGLTVSGRIDDGAWGYSVATNGNITFSGANAYDGGTSVTGSLTLANASAAGTGTIVADGQTVVIDGVTIGNLVRFAGGGTLRGRNSAGVSGVLFTSTSKVNLDAPTAADTLTLTGLSTGSSPVAITGAGEVVLAGPSDRTGNTSVDNGTLTIAHSGGAGFGEIAVNGNTLNINSNADVQNIVSVTTGTIGNTYHGGTLSGVLNLGGDAQISSSGLGWGLTVSAAIAETGGARKLAKTGGGTVTLWGSNAWSGGTDVRGGVLSANSALGAGDVLVRSGSSLNLGGAQFIADTAAVVVDGQLNLGGAEVIGALAGSGSVALGGNTLFVDAAGDSSFGGVISGAGGLVKRGLGKLALTGANTYTGATTISGGVLEAATLANGGVASSIGASSSAAGNLVLNGGALRYTGGTASTDRNFTVAGYGGIEVSQGSATLTFTGGSAATMGTLRVGPLGVPGGTLALAGTNAHTGATVVDSGTLELGGTLASTSVGIANAATLRLGAADRLADTATVTINSGGALDTNGKTDTVATANLYGGTLAGTGTLTATTYNLAGGQVDANLGAGTIDVAGITTTLNGTAAASAIRIYGGTLRLGNTADRLTGAQDVTIDVGATLDTGGASQSIGSGAAHIANNGTLVTGNAIDLGYVTGSGAARLGGNVSTRGVQSWGGPVQLTNDAVLSSTLGGDIQFSGTVDGAHDLTVNSAGLTSLRGAVGAGTALNSLTTGGGGQTKVFGSITTVQGQTYHDDVVLGGAVTAQSTGGGTIAFNGTVDGDFDGRALTVRTSGEASFAGAVGGLQALGSLSAYGAGRTTLAGNVSTTTWQGYGDLVLAGARSLAGSSIDFSGSVKGDGSDLALAGPATIRDMTGVGDLTASQGLRVWGTVDAGSVAVSGVTNLAGNVTTTGNQSYGAAVTVTGDSVLDAGSGDIAFASIVVGPGGSSIASLTTRNTGALTLGGPISGLTNLTIAGGPTAVVLPTTTLINTLDVTAAGSVSQSGALTADSVRGSAGGSFALENAGNSVASFGPISGSSVALANDGGLLAAGPISASAGMVRLTTTGGDLRIQRGVTSVSGDIEATASGAIDLAGGWFGTTGKLSTLSSKGQGLWGANSVGAFAATNTGGGSIQFFNTGASLTGLRVVQTAGGDITVRQTGDLTMTGGDNVEVIGNGNIDISSTGALSIAGSVSTPGTGNIKLTGGTSAVVKGTVAGLNSAISIHAAGGDLAIEQAVTGGSIHMTATGALSTAGAIQAVSGNAVLSAHGDLALGSSVNAAGGSTTLLFGAIGPGSTFSTVAGISAAPTGTVTIRGGGGNDRIDLGSAGAISAGTVLVDGTGGSDTLVGRDTGTAFTISGIDSGSTADGLGFSGIENLTGGSGSDSFRLAAMGSLSGAVDGGAGADTLDVSARLATVHAATGTVAGLAGGFYGIESIVGGAGTTLAGSAFDLTGANSGTVDGVSYSGAAHLQGVGAANAFTGSGGSIQGTITGAAVPTTLSGTLTSGGAQSYGGAVALAAATTVASTGGAAVGFNGTVTGAHALAVNTSGATSFGGAVDLASLSTDAGGSTALNGGAVTTTGSQSYGDNVTLGADTTLAGVGIRFDGSVDSAAAANRSLTVNDSGTTVFGGAVGTSQRLSSLTTDAAGTTRFDSNSDTRTTGDQTYNDAVLISGWRNFDSSGASTLRFASTVDGVTAGADSFVTVGAASTTRLDGAVGGTTAFSGVAFGSGSILLNGGSVTTRNPLGGHTYNGAVQLGAHTTLAAHGGSINFNGTVDGGFALSANTSGVTDFRGAVGAVQALTGLTTDAGGSTLLAGGDVNAASQVYNDAVSIGGGRTLAGAVTFGSTVDASSGAGGESLTVTGDATFNGRVGGNRVLDHVSVGGAGAIHADVTTSGRQTYTGAVTLEGARTLAGTAVAFGSTVDGTAGGAADSLAVTGDARFGGAVGAGAALDSVTVVGAATLGGDVTTTGNQSYGGIILAANGTLSANGGAGNIATGAVIGGGKDLTLTGIATIGAAHAVGALTANQALTTTGAVNAGSVTVAGTATLGGDVTTTGNQSYGSTALATHSSLSANAGAGTIATGVVTGGGKDLTLTGIATIGSAHAMGALTANQALTTTGAVSAGSVTVAGAATLGGDVTTTGNQSYGSTALKANTLLSAGAGAGTIAIGVVAGGGKDLTLTGQATIGAGNALGALTANQALTTTGAVSASSVTVAGAATLGGDVTTTDNQTYGSTALTANTILSANAGAGTIAIGPLSGGGQDLTLNGQATIGTAHAVGALTANQALTTTGAVDARSVTVAGAATLGGNVTTAGAQSYQGAAALTGATTLSSTGHAGIGFASGLAGGGNDLTIMSSGTSFLANATGIGTFTAGTDGTTSGAIVAAVYNLNGGTVNASLGAGTLNQVGGTSTLNGTSAASTVNVTGGTLQLGNAANRLAGATTVAIGAGATLNTGTTAQILGTITNAGTLATGADLSAAGISSSGTASFGGNVTTTGAQSYTGTLRTAAGSTLEAAGSLTAGNATIGDGTTLRLNGAGTIEVAGNYAGAVKVDGGATRVALTDASAATPFVINQMTVDPGASVTLDSAGALTVDAANLSPLARLEARVTKGDATFLNSLTLRNGQPGVLATGGIALQVDEGNLNTQADPMWINVATPNMSVTISGDHKAWLSGNVSSDAVIRRILSSAQDGVGASRAEMVREFLHELKRNVGVGAVEDLVLSGGIDMEGITAPLNFSNLAVRLPRCANEQANQQPCN